MLEKTPKCPLNYKEIKSGNPKGKQSWIVIWRTDAVAEAPVLGHLMQRTDSLEKTLMLGKIEGGRRRGWQDEMVGWHHRLNGPEFEQTPGDSEGQGSLVSMISRRVRPDLATEQQNGNHIKAHWFLIWCELSKSHRRACVRTCTHTHTHTHQRHRLTSRRWANVFTNLDYFSGASLTSRGQVLYVKEALRANARY